MNILFPKRQRVLHLIIVLLLNLLACKDVEPEPPKLQPFIKAPDPSVSSLNLPFVIPLEGLEKYLNKVLPKKLYTTDKQVLKNSFKLSYQIFRNGKVKLSGAKGKLRSRIPLKAQIQVDWDFCKKVNFLAGGKQFCIQHQEKGDAELVMTLHSNLDINEQWELVPTTSSDFRVDKAMLTIGPAKIRAEELVDSLLSQNKNIIDQKINLAIARSFNVKKEVEKLWSSLKEPISIPGAIPSWLIIKPVSVRMSEAKYDKGKLIYNMGVDARLKTVLGNKPPAQGQMGLPPLKHIQQNPEQFYINLPIVATYDSLSELIKKQMMGQVYWVKDKVKLELKDIETFGNGKFIVMKVLFNAQVPDKFFEMEGHVFLQGLPIYDPKRQVLTVESFSYDVNTKNVLGEVADWMLHKKFLKEMKQRLELSLAEQISKSRLTIQKAVNQIKLDKVKLKGTVSQLVPLGVYPTSHDVDVQIVARGQFSAELNL